MVINKNIVSYLVSDNASLYDALRKIDRNKHRIVYLVDENNYLLSSLSDGDIRRWILANKNLDFLIKVGEVSNQQCFCMEIDEDPASIQDAFNSRIISIPLVDKSGRLIAIAEQVQPYIEFGNHRISEDEPVFIIAEIGNNHQGDIKLAKSLVDLAIKAGVDCVKFQMRNVKNLYRNSGSSNDASADLGTQYTLDLLSKFQLTDEQLFEVFDYCKEKEVLPLCTPWDQDSLQKLEGYGMPAYKVASADFTNYELLEALAKTGKPLICSTGMSSESEISSTVSFLKKKNAQVVLLHCNSTYPTPFKDVHLKYLSRLAKNTNMLVGYSGHERGWSVPIASIALGARVIEKHFTIDRGLEGSDHRVSLLPEEMKLMVEQIRQVEVALGEDKPRNISQGELINREVLAKSLVVNRDASVGEIVTKEMISVKSPGQGLQPNRIDELVGQKVVRTLKKYDYFYESDLNEGHTKKEIYFFERPYGIPVRYHDYQDLTENIKLDFVEFHLSYRDLDVKLEDYIEFDESIGFAVHAPELFAGDHILDLSSESEVYRNRSISELRRVIEQTNELKKYLPKTIKPVIVVNAGGWSVDSFLSKKEKKVKYSRIREAFTFLDLTGVEIAIQTMPPFPWHFGGQSHHNLFLDPYEIGLKICLDTSHSMMACSYYGWDFYEFVRLVAPYNVHIHIADAKGVDGEGVQNGHGDIDFKKLGELLEKYSPGVQFIPEVWQGHKDRGRGFWDALNYLEVKL